jgi:hypothetical protein
MAELAKLEIKPSEKKVERTVEHTDTVLTAKPYHTDKGNLQGIEFKLKGLPYPVRVLTKDLPALFIGSKVRFTGVMETYKEKEYFRPMDIEVVEQSVISMLATAGVGFSGKLN